MRPDFFGPDVASHYDESEAAMFDASAIEPALDVLAPLAGGRGALEFGIGTGRVALPLAGRGVEVAGIDLSDAMVAELRAKPGGEAIPVAIGDFASTKLQRKFALVYLVFNTIMNLTTLEDQIACFRNANDHLEPEGTFVIEVGVPQLRRLPPGETVRAFEVSPHRLGFDEFDTATQRLTSHHYAVRDGKLELHSIPFRYVWPSELDLMARLAGLRLRERWGGWGREPFTGESVKHVSVWEKPR